ncbi:hypothetical protein [Halomarina pelagica]|uniref:hypothetical protein n=1 Tax=Halomarina pelagica TaxID=2961599 RepID=UPI0020C3F84B|nr:hypothetical protein [Halomarina sp. BND7]
MSTRSRRRFLVSGASSLAALATLGGCSSPGLTGEPAAPALGRVWISNFTDRARRIEVRVLRDGGVVHERAYDVPAARKSGEPGERDVECAWSNEAGHHVVRARHAGDDEWTSLDLTADSYPSEAYGINVAVGSDVSETDAISMAAATDPAVVECGSRSS